MTKSNHASAVATRIGGCILLLALAACGKGASPPPGPPPPDLAPPTVANCPNLPALCASDVRNTACKAPQPDCTLLTAGYPLRCQCFDLWPKWICQDCRCADQAACPDPAEDVTCSVGYFEPEYCKCIHPEKEWACFLSYQPFYCVTFPGPIEGRPCFCGGTRHISDKSPPGQRCLCINDHWHCEATD